ncbi:PREDICTED: uncharacterized protein LOC108447451 [Corvus brachyrhynchos]|uniref:uncharacterized protein LOC108447451 n=1 Tax=Corvus brachyrhynchos TaxID=85066 RepID=UPI00081636D6|nr:PREDICTED: uncharacterized protein LOC108447451 [Corvus brachyrhynchos]
MQIIRVLNTDLLSPFDIKHLGQVLFQPVQYQVFEADWRRMAEKAAAGNMQLRQTDPRCRVPADALMGLSNYGDPDAQAAWHPQILEQAQRIGMGALLKGIDMAAPKTQYVKISQGPKEHFLSFVEKIAVALEKQVEDEAVRQLLCRQLARDNANDECRRIIDALPGEPTLTQNVEACAKVGSVEHRSALAAVLRPLQVNSGGQKGQPKTGDKQKQIRQKNRNKENGGIVLCKRCGRPGHSSDYCQSAYHVDGRALLHPGKNGLGGAWGNCAQVQMFPQAPPTQAYSASLQPAPGHQLGWMCTLQQQSS